MDFVTVLSTALAAAQRPLAASPPLLPHPGSFHNEPCERFHYRTDHVPVPEHLRNQLVCHQLLCHKFIFQKIDECGWKTPKSIILRSQVDHNIYNIQTWITSTKTEGKNVLLDEVITLKAWRMSRVTLFVLVWVPMRQTVNLLEPYSINNRVTASLIWKSYSLIVSIKKGPLLCINTGDLWCVSKVYVCACSVVTWYNGCTPICCIPELHHLSSSCACVVSVSIS